MSKKCRAYSESKLGLEPTDNRKAFYAGWDAALAQQEEPVEPVAWQWLDTAHFRKKIPADATPSSGRPLYTTPPQRKPLAEWQIDDLMSGIDPEDVCSWSFRQGVYAAEKHHGVKP